MYHGNHHSPMEQDHERDRDSYADCTQTQMDVIYDPSVLSQSHPEGQVEEPQPWAKFVPSTLSSKLSTMEFYEQDTCENGMFHKHSIGRSRSNNHVLDDARISSTHCILFCQRMEAGGESSFVPCLVDQSANGTYVNGARLRKGARHVLKTGDELALVNPTSVGPKISFMVQLFLNGNRQPTYSGPTDSAAIDGGLRHRGATVKQMLHQGRDINDYYDLVKIVGEGAYGQVYAAIERNTGLQRAVKVVDTTKAALSSPTFVNTLLAEAEIMRTLEHPLIVQLVDVFANGPVFYFVMELLSGGDLFDRVVKKGSYSECDANSLMRKLLTAIAYIHSRGIAHRDLKIENIMLESISNDVDIKVTDFGLAKSGEAYQTFCGTPNYYAPEVLERKHNVRSDSKYSTIADMWSCGVILYVLLCGEMPWKGSDPEAELRRGRFATNVRRWGALSDSVKSLIKALLQPNPKLRLTAEEALKHDWFREPASSAPVPAAAPARSSARRVVSSVQNAMSIANESGESSNMDTASVVAPAAVSPSRRSSTRIAQRHHAAGSPGGLDARGETRKRGHSSDIEMLPSVSMRGVTTSSTDDQTVTAVTEIVAEDTSPAKRIRTVAGKSKSKATRR